MNLGSESVQRQVEDVSPGPEDYIDASELRREIQNALNQLEEHHRLAIVLRDIQGLSYEKVGEILDCPLGTVKSRINRGRQQLKSILQKNNVLQ
jgi:RNA polymerase sigma-70 factor (ECF subfamily)